MYKSIVLIAFALIFSACTKTAEPVFINTKDTCIKKPLCDPEQKTKQKRVVYEIKSIPSSQNDANMIRRLVQNIAKQLNQVKGFQKLEKSSIVIRPFISLDDLHTTLRLSNILSESLLHEMQGYGHTLKLSTGVEVKKLFKEKYALIGTYIEYKSATVVNAKIVDLKTGLVLSTAQASIPSRIIKRISK